MGLLDMLQSDDPAVKQGLIQFGLGLLSSKGNFGNALGNAGQQGLAGALGYRDRQAQQKRAALQDQLTQGQIAQQGQQQKSFEQQQAEWARQQELRNLPGQFVTQGMKPDTMDNRDVGMPGEQTIPTGFDQTGYLNALKGKDFNAWLTTSAALQKPASKFSTTPQYDQDGNAFVLDEQGNRKMLDGVKARDKVEIVNGIAVNPYQMKPGQVAPQNPNQPFGYGPDGKMTPNELYQQFAQRTAKAGATTVKNEINTGQKGYENESKLRNDFKAEPIYKDYNDMLTAHKQIKAGIASGTPIGDVATTTKIMKLLDPGSVVRESELGIAMAAGGRMDKLQNIVQMWMSGDKLTPQQRKDFGALADELMSAAGQAYNNKRSEYEKMGSRYGLDGSVLGSPWSAGGAPAGIPDMSAIDAEIARRAKGSR